MFGIITGLGPGDADDASTIRSAVIKPAKKRKRIVERSPYCHLSVSTPAAMGESTCFSGGNNYVAIFWHLVLNGEEREQRWSLLRGNRYTYRLGEIYRSEAGLPGTRWPVSPSASSGIYFLSRPPLQRMEMASVVKIVAYGAAFG